MTTNLPLDVACPTIWRLMRSEPTDGVINRWQFFDPSRELAPEEKLAAAMFAQACEDFLAAKVKRKHFETARDWIAREGLDAWAFDWVCSTLHLDASYIRRLLRENEPAREFVVEPLSAYKVTLKHVNPMKIAHIKRCLQLNLTAKEIMTRCQCSQEVIREVGIRAYGKVWLRERALRILRITHSREYRAAHGGQVA